ncbi:MAG: DUF1592 domain-containing protein [Verrucomicrobia bacterium]|nr:DUF1592 domain-containing protein [Verrucomicrobiota bacterium]
MMGAIQRVATGLAAVLATASCVRQPDPVAPRTGAEAYASLCSSCHGPGGEGVPGRYDGYLHGELNVAALTRVIADTMPKDAPQACTGDAAARVAAHIHGAFYSPDAYARIRPSRIDLSHLTIAQFENSVADLVGSFRGRPPAQDGPRGLQAEIFDGREFRRDKRKLERTDAGIAFDFGTNAPPGSGTGDAEFAIRWRGSVLATDTGDHEFRLRTGNGARLWVNGEAKPLLDAWVSSGGEAQEHRATTRLLAGRAHPLRVDFFKFKDKSAAIALEWRRPLGTWEPIPDSALLAATAPEVLVVTTPFPPDDGSLGYARGTAVSKAWDEAVTQAALDFASRMAEQLDALAGTRPGAPDRAAKLRNFCGRLAERAFRRPLTESEKAATIAHSFDTAPDPETGVKRVLLRVLKSPYFLYPEPSVAGSPGRRTASRLALTLWDSLPDDELLRAADSGALASREQVDAQAQRMLKDARAHTKIRGFLHQWLDVGRAADVTKDAAAFPGFDATVLADMRTSLDLFLDDVVWSAASDYRELLGSDHLFVNARLAKFCGLPAPEGDGFARVTATDGARAGVLTHPLILTMYAYHKSSSPIHRGVFLTRNVMGRTLKPPPEAIEFKDDRFDPTLSMREKVEQLTKPAACQGCHSIINPLGFSLENFDGVGRFRTSDSGKPVNAVSDYPATDGGTARFSDARSVAAYAAASPDAQRGFVQHFFHHLVKQPVRAYGPGVLESLRGSFLASGFNMRELAAGIARTAALHEPPAAAADQEL